MPNMPSPANTSSSSGPGSNHSGSGLVADPVAVPQAIEQVAFTYVNITTLFLSAHDLWEQAEELVQKGSGKNGWKRGGFSKGILLVTRAISRELPEDFTGSKQIRDLSKSLTMQGFNHEK